jgi:hypothetical protein
VIEPADVDAVEVQLRIANEPLSNERLLVLPRVHAVGRRPDDREDVPAREVGLVVLLEQADERQCVGWSVVVPGIQEQGRSIEAVCLVHVAELVPPGVARVV